MKTHGERESTIEDDNNIIITTNDSKEKALQTSKPLLTACIKDLSCAKGAKLLFKQSEMQVASGSKFLVTRISCENEKLARGVKFKVLFEKARKFNVLFE